MLSITPNWSSGFQNSLRFLFLLLGICSSSCRSSPISCHAAAAAAPASPSARTLLLCSNCPADAWLAACTLAGMVNAAAHARKWVVNSAGRSADSSPK
ncbi:hypothetical protein COO60DRAFT_1036205 [Scenedesmus sp. NREL 46B-D3]|nr:hypothetical protein COO60DRAFT_1036205 [Scenedesmus sp. NREL 46B-D3]